ncbi:hypothetical protein Nepgr_014736 [Nepenthes gracilis]|uniref:Uncharacterized protein n=1 Tax=Nepenthes gracilis TaxID=150966 RepID=A0AAD3SLG9_NEPGR|nr:hypothetical protein Nepgr_014736 [Nepenthes gracilis]
MAAETNHSGLPPTADQKLFRPAPQGGFNNHSSSRPATISNCYFFACPWVLEPSAFSFYRVDFGRIASSSGVGLAVCLRIVPVSNWRGCWGRGLCLRLLVCDASLKIFASNMVTAAPVNGVCSGFEWGSGALAL